MSTDCQKTTAKAIPSTRRVPGSSTDRKFLLECRSSPVAKTPPRGLPNIPGVTSPPSRGADEKACNGELLNNNSIPAPESSNTGDDSQFEMDI
ncbi:Eukaryotic translation initiation factor 4E-binding protein 1 [Larimichthys crocea]|uniref:Uncharacterized protein n=1 Tax=Larimichthys crocea TaxID=215358 RepID=A0ACD3Q9U0_LARCR|nr:Eukaryotic translation initiation factor 4E-binding protein 1 [Larimichthys crocea]